MKQSITLTPRNFVDLMEPTGNIYETTAIIAERTKQIVSKIKQELDVRFADFATHVDSLEEIFENKERIEMSKSYERQPKPSILATEEFLANKIMHGYPEQLTTPLGM